MIFSQTAYYAMRAVYYLLTTSDNEWHLTKDVAESTKIPAPYLARIMSTLAKRGILRSRTGMGGGFSISNEGMNQTLYDVVTQFDNFDNVPECMFGFTNCKADDHNYLHEKWTDVKERLVNMLKETKLGALKHDQELIDWQKVESV